MNDSSAEKPKIIVDEDWKSQVQAEKETLRQTGSEKKPRGEQAAQLPPIPTASFSTLVSTLATQASLTLGQAQAPDDQEVPVDLGMAKHLIDTLAMLEEKTKGNLTPDESGLLTELLYQLRMLFVTVQSQVKKHPPAPEKKTSIETP